MNVSDLGSGNGRRVLVIGWDGADWRVIRPLLERGRMPVLRRMMESGVHGNITTLSPALSPMLWTSIATGKRPYKHGVLGFMEPTLDASSVRPVTNRSRTTRAVWNMLHLVGRTPIVVGWWPSHPAEPIRGAMVSNHFQRAPATSKPDHWPVAPGAVHPERLIEPLAEFRYHPLELTGDHLVPFIPKLEEIDQQKDQRVMSLAKIVSEITSIHGAATALMQSEPWDFMGVYYDGVDHFSHAFMRYHPPRQEWIDEREFDLYCNVVEAGYRYHDMMLGALLALAGEDTTVILLSDHGFHPDHLRWRELPVEPAGPAVEHRDLGIFVMRGPGVRAGGEVHGVSVLDIAPTVLTAMGLPIGDDMDGKPVVTAYEEPPEITRIESWDLVEGEDGSHGESERIDPIADAEAVKQLVDLGYIEAPPDDAQEAVRECTRELQYNLARAYMDGARIGSAAPILEDLWTEWPDEHRFGEALIRCLGSLGELDRRAETIDLYEARVGEHAKKARAELEEIEPEIKRLLSPDAETALETPADDDDTERAAVAQAAGIRATEQQRLRHRVRRLSSLAASRAGQIAWLRLSQSIETGALDEARRTLDGLMLNGAAHPSLSLSLGAAELRVHRHDKAVEWFERALAGDSENAQARLGLAEAAIARRDWAAAAEEALCAIELAFHLPRAHTLLGRSLWRSGDADAAERALRVALAQAPGSAPALRALAGLLSRYPDRREEAREIRQRLRARREERVWTRGRERLDYRERSAPSRANDGAGPADPASAIIIVTGLPRSGTSMMMQMLAAGGIEVVADDERSADDSNPRGYFEDQRVTRLGRDAAWLSEARGKAIKIVAPLIPLLPRSTPALVVFMDRPIQAVMRSQRAMLERLGREGSRLSDEALAAALTAHTRRAKAWTATAPHADLLILSYDDVITHPDDAAARVVSFLGRPLDAAAMAAAVDPGLRRQVVTAAPPLFG